MEALERASFFWASRQGSPWAWKRSSVRSRPGPLIHLEREHYLQINAAVGVGGGEGASGQRDGLQEPGRVQHPDWRCQIHVVEQVASGNAERQVVRPVAGIAQTGKRTTTTVATAENRASASTSAWASPATTVSSAISAILLIVAGLFPGRTKPKVLLKRRLKVNWLGPVPK